MAIVAIVLGLAFAPGQAAWEQTGGPPGGEIQSLARIGNLLFATTRFDGVYQSEDGGASWSRMEDAPRIYLQALVAIDSNLYLGTDYAAVHRYSLGDKRWTQIDNGPLIGAMYRMAALGKDLLFPTSAGFYRYSENGSTLFKWYEGRDLQEYSTIMVVHGLTFVTLDGSVFRSADTGKSWTRLSLLRNTTIYLPQTTGDPPHVFASALEESSGNWLYRSTDSGNTWKQVKQLDANANLRSLTVHGGDLYIGTENHGVYRSTDDGATWTFTGGGPDMALISMGDRLVGGAYNGVFRSADKGATWKDSERGLRNTYVQGVSRIGTDLFAATDGGAFRSPDDGDTWKRIDKGLGSLYVQAIARNGSVLFAGTSGGEGLYRSTDNGSSWTGNQGMAGNAVFSLVVDGSDMFAGSSGGVYHSTDRGASWRQPDTTLADKWIVELAYSRPYLFAATGPVWQGDAELFRSPDNGATWKKLMLPPGVKNINALATSGTCLLAGTSSGLMKFPSLSSDAVPIQVDALPMEPRSLLPVGGSIYAGMHGGIAVSEDQGETWTNLNHDQPFNVVTSLAVSDKHLFLGTFGEAVWRLPREDAVPTRVPAPGDSPFAGNPGTLFGPRQRIGIQVRKAGRVSLSVFNLLGARAATLLEADLPPGPRHAELDAGTWPEGVYFLRLIADGKSHVHRFVLKK